MTFSIAKPNMCISFSVLTRCSIHVTREPTGCTSHSLPPRLSATLGLSRSLARRRLIHRRKRPGPWELTQAKPLSHWRILEGPGEAGEEASGTLGNQREFMERMYQYLKDLMPEDDLGWLVGAVQKVLFVALPILRQC